MKNIQATQRDITCDNLKQLRVPGMIDGYRKQWDDPAYSTLSFDVRFSEIVLNEIDARALRRRERLLKEANLKNKQASFERIIVNDTRNIDWGMLEELKQGHWLRANRHPSLLVTGRSGCGKSFICEAFLRLAIEQGLSASSLRHQQLNEKFHDARAHNKSLALRTSLANKKVLLIDDFLMGNHTQEDEEDLLALIDMRNQNTTTIIASQYEVSLWHDRFHSPVIADAFMDRIAFNSYRIELKGESLRKLLAEQMELDV